MHGGCSLVVVTHGVWDDSRPILAPPSDLDGRAMFRNRFFLNYLIGIASIAIGAGVTSMTGSMLPLSMGGAVGIMCTYSLVRAIWQGKLKGSKRR